LLSYEKHVGFRFDDCFRALFRFEATKHNYPTVMRTVKAMIFGVFLES